ncbi:MAG: hypothetical protein IJU90_08845 [Bacteroidales bacterium]|nr:hypothetical protein [Bacteroidales bacterium]
MKRCFGFYFFATIVAALFLFTSCAKEKEEEISFNQNDLVGKWLVSNTQLYWKYEADGTGVTWDESQDVGEGDETTMRFTWTLTRDRLSHVFSGDEVHQAVVQDYTVKELSSSRLVWNDGLEDVTLTKVVEQEGEQ